MMDFLSQNWGYLLAGALVVLEIIAIAAAVHAVMNVRTAQGSVAWMLALLAAPFISLPLYAAFGAHKFSGYVLARRSADGAIEQLSGNIDKLREPVDRHPSGDGRLGLFEAVAGTPFSGNNSARLLIDGDATFRAIFEALEAAQSYILVQFYIIKDDTLGSELQQRLIEAAARGVRVYLLYDAVGSHALPAAWIRELQAAGIQTVSFTGTTRRVRRLQINFRNHRKIVVVDGITAFVGGHNVGDEYLGRDPALAPWRDTHVQIDGPAAMATQIPFAQDWFWAAHESLSLDWQPQPAGTQAVLSLPTGPADSLDSCTMTFVHGINSAQQRLWIVSPYFVPNGSVIDALKLAILRGVDVRILLPARADNRVVQLAGHAYTPELIANGVRVFRFTGGFLHQKVMLVDDDLAFVGTANIDNRSFRLNFEITMLVRDRPFAAEVETMLENDFAISTEVDALAVATRRWWFSAATRGARLLSPIL